MSECEEILESLKHGYKGLTAWQEETKADAARRMYSETWIGRRRYLPGIGLMFGLALLRVFDEQQKKIDAFPLPPSMIMKTQKSYHVYWFMDGSAKVERFRMIQTQLVKHFDGDPMCVNESRVMRLPGFMHCKKDTPVEVTCVSFHPERKYTQDQLSDVLPEVDLG